MSLDSSLARPLVVLALSVPLFAGSLFVRDHVSSLIGPLAIASQGDSVAVIAPGRLYHLAGDGTLQAVDDGVIDPGARDAGLAWVGNELLASPGLDGELLRCTTDGCRPFTTDTYAPRGAVQVGQAGDVLWLSERGLDRIQRFRVDGSRLDMPVSDLVQPGSIVQQEDLLLVCNTGIGKIERYTLHEHGVDYPPEVFAQFSEGEAEDDPVSQPLRLLARADGGYSALFRNAAGTRGLLADIGADGTVMPRVVAELVNPVALAVLGDDLLVVDEDRMQVLQVTADGSASLFGDDEFNAQLSAQRQLRDALRIAWPLLAVLAALAAAIGGSMLLAQWLKRFPEGPLPVKAGDDGVAWLVPESALAVARAQRSALALVPAALAPALVAGWLGYALIGVLFAVGVLVAAVVPALRAASRGRPPAGLRIGLRGKQLVIADTERGMRQYLLSHVDWNEQQLRAGPEETVVLARDDQPYFHRPTLEAVLFPQLDRKRRIMG